MGEAKSEAGEAGRSVEKQGGAVAPVRQRTFGDKVTRALAFFLVFVLLGTAAYTWVTLNYTYASGERAGYVQKLSRKGWLCKTWEGELAMVNVPGSLTEKFEFTVPDGAVAESINRILGQQVVLNYEQHVGIPSSCFGETPYFVTNVRPMISPAK
jgi:hypothetical protein